MEPLSTSDPAFLETCHRWLLFHYHCNECGQGEDSCEYGKVCSSGKSAFVHVQGCNKDECGYPRCDLVKKILRHHQSCKDEVCKICAPVFKYQARSKQPPPPLPPSSPYATESSPGSATSSMQASEPPAAQSHSHSQSLPASELQSAYGGDAGGTMQQQQQQRSQQSPQLVSLLQHPLLLQASDLAGQDHAGTQVGRLFEARHREQKRHLTGGLARMSASDAHGGGGATAASSGVSVASAPSGSLDAMAELQALHLDQVSQRQQQQQRPQSLQGQQAVPPSEVSMQVTLQGAASGQSAAPMDFQGHQGLDQPQHPAPPQPQHPRQPQQPHSHGMVSPSRAPHSVHSPQQPIPVFATPGVQLPHATPQQQQQHPHSGIMYGTAQGQTIVLSGQPGQSLSLVSGVHLGPAAMQAQGVGAQQPAQGTAQQPPLGSSMSHFAATTMPAAFHLSPAQQPPQLQHPSAFASAAASLSAQAGVLQAGPAVQAASSSYMTVPLGTAFVQPPQAVQLAPIGGGAAGVTYTVLHHHPVFGPGGLAHQHPQQPAGGVLASGLAPMGATPGYLLGASQAVTALATIPMGCGPSAADGVGACAGPSWTFVQHGQQHLLQAHPQHAQMLHGTAAPSAASGSLLLAPQMAGAT